MVDIDLDRIHELIAKPEQIGAEDLMLIDQAIEQYPYFQSLRAVRLKLLKQEGSSRYNNELKFTASHTTDRGVLFDYITSEEFLSETGLTYTKNKEYKDIKTSGNSELESPTPVEDLNAATDFTLVTENDLFLKKTEQENLITDAPFEFNENESHSFTEWLKLTSVKPIDTGISATSEDQIPVDESKKSRMQKIDQFLQEQPKIKPSGDKVSSIDLSFQQSTENQLMTETLARIYTAQKNYSKAIKAYEIMALQHPEKSGFFADRIREVKELQINQ